MAGPQELKVVRLGYVVEEPLDNEVLSDTVLPIDHEGGDVDAGKPAAEGRWYPRY